MRYAKVAWLFLKQRSLAMFLMASLLFTGGLLLDNYFDGIREERDAVLTRQEIKDGIAEIKQRIDEFDKKMAKQNEILVELSEVNTCLFVIHIPAAEVQRFFPGADVEKCKVKLGGFNNLDGTFLPQEIDGVGTPRNQNPSPVSTPTPVPPCSLVIQGACILPELPKVD